MRYSAESKNKTMGRNIYVAFTAELNVRKWKIYVLMFQIKRSKKYFLAVKSGVYSVSSFKKDTLTELRCSSRTDDDSRSDVGHLVNVMKTLTLVIHYCLKSLKTLQSHHQSLKSILHLQIPQPLSQFFSFSVFQFISMLIFAKFKI